MITHTHTTSPKCNVYTFYTDKNNQSHLSDDFGDFDHFGDDLTAEFTITLAQDESFQIVGAGEGQRVLQMCRRMSLDDLRLNHDAIIATTQRTDTNTRPAMTSSLALGSRPKRHFLVRWLVIQFFWKKMSTEMVGESDSQ